MRIKTLIPTLLIGTALAGCSTFEPDYYNCESQLSSYAQGARASVTTDVIEQNVEVRFNGVSARCYDEGAQTIMQIGIGLKVLRDSDEGLEVAPVSVPMVAAIIDDEAVLSTQSFIYTMQFTKYSDVIYPLVRREVKLPKGGRVILSLTPELVTPSAS